MVETHSSPGLSQREDRRISIFDPDAAAEADRLYRQLIDQVAADGEDRLISNGRPEHAAYLIRKFFSHASADIRLYTGRLARAFGRSEVPVYADKDVIESAKQFLRRPGTRLTILSEHALDVDFGRAAEDHPLIRSLVKDDLKRGSLDVFRLNQTSKSPFHFWVMDDTAYRVETDHRKAKALVNFGGGEMASQLVTLFDLLIVVSNRLVPADAD